ncbi:Protein CBG08684 [Caenorhabditis briggsae]|uniref:Protein CBG08684 n=1 Tax=Caenorhabditis briggsae TaxID=6238 RepID=A8X6T6_CAEBR|nr:Protein CBG08684 [Caenorhabditis briggsae]CAP28347.1 Protein CBG08684 [Caenorhabditis briggsae]
MDSSTSCSLQDDTISNCAETWILDYDPVDHEELQNESMFEKPRGERRWLGKEHHRGKERLHNAVKDRTFIEKTVRATEPLSKNATKKIKASTRDGMEFNVIYSLDKKNRWETTNTVSFLGATPENLNAEVVEKNGLEVAGLMHPEKTTLAVHSRQIDPTKEPGDFDIRIAKSSGKGQHYSNFLPATREFSKKANARTMTIRKEPPSKKEPVAEPTISYNIYKTHPSQGLVGGQMFKSRLVSKSGLNRTNKKLDMNIYDDEEEDFDNDDEDGYVYEEIRPSDAVLNLASLTVGNRAEKQSRKSNRKDSELSYDFVQALEQEIEYSNLLDIYNYLRKEGYMFENADVTFHNQKDNIEQQMKELHEEDKLIIKQLRPKQYLLDASRWCQLDGEVKDGETTTVIVITHLKKNVYNVLVNSTLPCHPSKRGSDYLKRQISSAMTIREAVTRITTELITHRKVIETMKLASEFYETKTVPELIHDSSEWENQLVNMDWPNQHYHATWANSEELSQIGGKLEWDDLCAMVRKEGTSQTVYASEGVCGLCSREKRAHELFLVNDETRMKCTECLREEFYRELSAKQIPIDLQIQSADELELLPTFIPLTIVNLYIRITSEIIYKDLGATGDFEKCPSCKSAVFFQETPPGNEKKAQNRSCPCGYSWCKHCERVPHWPLKCGDYSEWEEKWLLRYAMTHAQGTGTETLLQITCSCAKQIYNVLLPVEFTECPGCKTNVNMNTMRTVWKHYYYPYDPMLRKYIQKGYYTVGQEYKKSPYVPRAKTYTDIVKIPGIRASVIEICKAARDIRYDVNLRNRAVNREHILIRKGVMEKEVVENLLGTSVYLVENVTAWMYVSNQYDRSIKNMLDSVMEHRKELVKMLEGEDSDAINESVKKLNRDIQSVVSSVERKIIETSII